MGGGDSEKIWAEGRSKGERRERRETGQRKRDWWSDRARQRGGERKTKGRKREQWVKRGEVKRWVRAMGRGPAWCRLHLEFRSKPLSFL